MIMKNHAKESTQANLLFIDELISGRLDDAHQEKDCDLTGKEIVSISPDGKYWTVSNESSPRSELFILKRLLPLRLKAFFKMN